MPQNLQELTHALLDAARKAGADAADAMAVQGTSLSIDVRGGALEQAERSEGVDIGLRVLIGQRQANVSASDTRPQTLDGIGGTGCCDGTRGARRPAGRAGRSRSVGKGLGY